ncbi:MAG: KEOPS complex subunit Pcc1 [Halanaeroarchaeum sp.]
MPRATIRTTVADPEAVAAAIRPDNTDAISTTVERADEDATQVVTRIDRETTGGLRSTLDDYVVNCIVADDIVQTATTHQPTTHE